MAISYLPTFIPTKILIIGCGGTGSRLVPLLAQFVKACPWVHEPEMTLVDDDIVEDKNLLRQNFISTDVGKYKAEVLAQRYSRAFDIKITASKDRVVAAPSNPNRLISKVIPGYTHPTPEQYEIFQKHSRNSIIVLCVDSPEARRDIISNMSYYASFGISTVLVLDSGNENDFGQVSVSTWAQLRNISSECKRYMRDWPNSIPGNMTIQAIPADLSYFYGMVAENTLSCADLDQTMAINTMMANAMFGIIQNFFYSKPISYHRLDVTLSNGITPQYITPRWLLKVNEFRGVHTNLDKSIPSISVTTGSGMHTSEQEILIDKWSRDGSLAGYPCQTDVEITTEVANFEKTQWLPFKKLNEQAAANAKNKELIKENKRLEDLRKQIEKEVMVKVKADLVREAYLASVASTRSTPEESKSPKSKAAAVSSKTLISDNPTLAWPLVKDSEEVKISPEAIKAIKAGLKEQEKLRETRFQTRLREVTERESTRGINISTAGATTEQPVIMDQWVDVSD